MGADKSITLNCTVENIVFKNDENDYCVLEVATKDGELITAVGIIPRPTEGEVLSLVGEWGYHKEFGKQFAFVEYDKQLPGEIDGIIQYLSSRAIKGVGPVTALKIVNKYGTDTFDVIENHPEWLATIPGITVKKAAVISESFREHDDYRRVLMHFKDYFEIADINRMYKRFGAGAITAVRRNPYVLCSGSERLAFDIVDRMAQDFGYRHDGDDRIIAGLCYVLEYNGVSNGHTCLPFEKLVPATADVLKLEPSKIAEMIEHFVRIGELSEFKLGANRYLMTPDVAENESYVAERLIRLSRTVPRFAGGDIATLIESIESGMCITYAPKQREALFRCLDGGVTIITGGPGTGKTTIIRALLAIFRDVGHSIVLAAPTGRATKRMSTATSEEAKTVHRLLEMERTLETREIRFNRNETNPLDEDVIIVDEASMIDLSLMNALTRAMRRGSRLILIGDIDQLPSVGSGNVLSDIIASEVFPVVRLTEVFRQSEESLIIRNAHNINSGIPPILTSTDKDFFFVRREDETKIAETVASLVMERLPRAYGKYIREDIQIITPSKRGLGGVDALNKVLQARINPPAEGKKEHTAHSTVFRVGDKVMQMANDYEIGWVRRKEEGIGIFNGDIGVIVDIDKQAHAMKIRFDDKMVQYEYEKLDQLELAYAITVHKSQGSEYPVVIVPMYSCPPMLMTRNLLYTAVTRAKRMVILVGRSDIPERMVANNREIKRYTTFKDRLISYAED